MKILLWWIKNTHWEDKDLTFWSSTDILSSQENTMVGMKSPHSNEKKWKTVNPNKSRKGLKLNYSPFNISDYLLGGSAKALAKY